SVTNDSMISASANAPITYRLRVWLNKGVADAATWMTWMGFWSWQFLPTSINKPEVNAAVFNATNGLSVLSAYAVKYLTKHNRSNACSMGMTCKPGTSSREDSSLLYCPFTNTTR